MTATILLVTKSEAIFEMIAWLLGGSPYSLLRATGEGDVMRNLGHGALGLAIVYCAAHAGDRDSLESVTEIIRKEGIPLLILTDEELAQPRLGPREAIVNVRTLLSRHFLLSIIDALFAEGTA